MTFRAGEGVGTVTRAGLPVPPGEPAINPVPRRMIRDAIAEIAAAAGRAADADVEISIPGGEALAAKTLNGRLGIVGGLSILGTTGIVVPYSCSAWIHSIHSGIEVARAAGLTHIAGATGASSEAGVQKLYGLPEIALIDMGDFVGGMLKYLRRHPVPRVTIAGGVAKMTKLAQGLTDLHSKRGEVDLAELANFAAAAGGDAHLCQRIVGANTAAEAFTLAQDDGIALGDAVALAAQQTAEDVIAGRDIAVEVVLFDREQNLVGRAPFEELESCSCGTSAEAAAIIGVVERAVAEIFRGERAADEISARCARFALPLLSRRCRRACRAMTRCCAELACTTTAAGQSAP